MAPVGGFGAPPVKRYAFRFDPKDEKQARAAGWIAAFDFAGAVDFGEAATPTLTLPDGTTHTGAAAGSQAMWNIPGVKWLWWVSFVPAVRRALGA